MKNTSTIISNLRQLMRSSSHIPKQIDAYIVPSGDAHLSEYTAECDRRREFVTGFSGSMGTAIVATNEAALWVDSRYYIQAEEEIDQNWKLMKTGLPDTKKEGAWLLDLFKRQSTEEHKGFTVGVDPLLYSCDQWKSLCKELTDAGHELVPVVENLVDLVWGDEQPKRPQDQVTILEERWTGKSLKDKLVDLREKIAEKDCTAIVLTALDDIAYVLNLRGKDIPFNPVFFSYAIVEKNAASLFIDECKLSAEVSQYLTDAAVAVKPYGDLVQYLKKVVEGLGESEKVWIPSSCSHAVADCVPEKKRHKACTPVTVAKAIKNDTELAGMELSHIRDGAALCAFLCWLQDEAPKSSQNECSAADKLQLFRSKQEHFKDLSFETISSVGSNAAIVHYKPAEETCKTVTDTEIYLVDSGGHYSDGTTDVTRTVHFGTPTAEEIDTNTRVLKGHIALARAIFPEKTKGNCLDSFARQYLWNAGLNYGHGTGHGVGMYLNVHEGPMGISIREYPNDCGLQEGMVLSNEPGYYKAGHFGTRIESLVKVVKAETLYSGEEKKYLTFKTITMAPIQRKLIDSTMLDKNEVEWLNSYHAEVLDKVGPILKQQQENQAYQWLAKETLPL